MEKNPDFRFIILLLLSLSLIFSFVMPAYAADTSPVSITSLIQSEDDSTVYELTFVYNGSEYKKIVSGVTGSPVIYLYNNEKIVFLDSLSNACVDTSKDYFYKTSVNSSSATVRWVDIQYSKNQSIVDYSISSMSGAVNAIGLSKVTILYSSYDIVDKSTGETFFPNPPQWTILTGVPILSPLAQVVGLIPIVLFWVVLYLSLRKGLSQLLMVLKTG